MLQREHRSGGFVDRARECKGPLQDRRKTRTVLDTRLWIFVFDHQERVRRDSERLANMGQDLIAKLKPLAGS